MLPETNFLISVVVLFPVITFAADLDCLKELSSADGICSLDDDTCCISLHTQQCRVELIARDEPSMTIGFLPDSLVFDPWTNFLCIVGLQTTPGEQMSNFIGCEVHVRKEHIESIHQETSHMTFILEERLRGAVPRDQNPLENMTMCQRLGNKFDSLSQDVFVTVEVIPLNPNINEAPLVYPTTPFLCELDTVYIQQKGECGLRPLNREPHQCRVEQTTVAVQHLEKVHNLEEEIEVEEDVTSSPFKNSFEETRMWIMDRFWILVVVIVILVIVTCTALVVIAVICKRVQTTEDRLREMEYQQNPIPADHYERTGETLHVYYTNSPLNIQNQSTAIEFQNPMMPNIGQFFRPQINNNNSDVPAGQYVRDQLLSYPIYSSIHYGEHSETTNGNNQIYSSASHANVAGEESEGPVPPSPGVSSANTTLSGDSQTNLNG